MTFTVNGKQVHSNKQIKAIINCHVSFTDGSWCDVNTGSIHNAGPGYIRIGNTGNDAGPVTEVSKRSSAEQLMIGNITADIHVDVHPENYIEYTITGPTDEVEAIRANDAGGMLVITGPDVARSEHINIGGAHITSGSVTISNGVSFTSVSGYNTRMSENATKVEVKMPKGTPIGIDHVLGDVAVGNTDGPVYALISSSYNMSFGRVTDANLSVKGSGYIHVDQVGGEVKALVQGSGDIDIKRGRILSLTAAVQGSGDIRVGGSAVKADLTVYGSGDIRVARVMQNPVRQSMGSGDIKVGRIG